MSGASTANKARPPAAPQRAAVRGYHRQDYTELDEWIAAQRRAVNRTAVREFLQGCVGVAFLIGLCLLGSWLTSLV